jgi:hypothetical protein
MKKIQLVLAAVALILLPSCRFVKVNGTTLVNAREGVKIVKASDTMAVKDTVVSPFSSMSCNVACDVVYTPGECSVKLSGPDNILPLISIVSEDGLLKVRKEDKVKFNRVEKLTLTVSCPQLESVNFNGAVDFSAPAGIEAPAFSAEVNGAADMEIKGLKTVEATLNVNGAADVEIEGIDCSSLKMEINGAGDIVLSGRADKAVASINGAGDIDASCLDCKDFSSRANGLGSIKKPKN